MSMHAELCERLWAGRAGLNRPASVPRRCDVLRLCRQYASNLPPPFCAVYVHTRALLFTCHHSQSTLFSTRLELKVAQDESI